MISAPFFLIDFYLVESIVSFAKKCSTTLKWLPYRHSGHFKWSKRELFFERKSGSQVIEREKKSLWVRNLHLLLKMTSFSVIKLYVLLSEKVRKWQIYLSFTFIIWRLKYDRMLHIRLYLGQSFFLVFIKLPTAAKNFLLFGIKLVLTWIPNRNLIKIIVNLSSQKNQWSSNAQSVHLFQTPQFEPYKY